MQVYSWRATGSELGRIPKRPNAPWSTADVEGIPANHDLARTIFDGLLAPAGDETRSALFRVGVTSGLSPAIGVYRNGMAELSRTDLGNQVHITWLRGFWDQLNVIYRSTSKTDTRDFARQLVDRGRDVNGQKQIRLAGNGELRVAPYFVFVLVGGGRGISTVSSLRAGPPTGGEPR